MGYRNRPTIKMCACFFAITMFGLSARAQDRTSAAFVPAVVADQANLSVDMLDWELDQFVQNGKALAAQTFAPQLQRSYEEAVVEAARAEELYKTNSASLEEVRSKQTARDSARYSIELNAAAEKASRARAEVSKFRILEKGRENAALLVEASKAQLAYLEALQILTKKAKEKTDAQFRLASFLEENGRKLAESGAMARQEYDQRVLAKDKAANAVKTAQIELDALTPALNAARRTVQRVGAGPQ
jgi:hypothetical protein